MQIDIQYIRFLFNELDAIRFKIILIKYKSKAVQSTIKKNYYKQYLNQLKKDYRITYEELASYADEIWAIDKVTKTKFI